MYIAFLDEFGHIGPYVSRSHGQYNHSPVFGLAGFIMPHHRVRPFATWFYQNKNNLLSAEVKLSPKHPATWEKKGKDLINTKNITKYVEIRKSLFRLINTIYRCNGRLFYYGREKYMPAGQANASGLYSTVIGHAVRKLDRFCTERDEMFMMILDQHSDRIKLLETTAKTMFGNNPARALIEPPFQVESHLYQTIQAADWIATLVGRLWTYRLAPQEFHDWDWAETLFGQRVDSNVTHSSMWRPKPIAPAAAIAAQVSLTAVSMTAVIT